MIYLRARYYNPLTRRFLNSDPARDGWNWYGYAVGNPLVYVDPTGLGVSSTLDAIQTGLSVLGLVPVLGEVFDVVNAGVSLARGNHFDSGVNLMSAILGIGQAATGLKFAAAGGALITGVRVHDRAEDVANAGTTTANKLDNVLALPSPRQVDFNMGAVNNYRHGGQISAIEHINYLG